MCTKEAGLADQTVLVQHIQARRVCIHKSILAHCADQSCRVQFESFDILQDEEVGLSASAYLELVCHSLLSHNVSAVCRCDKG